MKDVEYLKKAMVVTSPVILAVVLSLVFAFGSLANTTSVTTLSVTKTLPPSETLPPTTGGVKATPIDVLYNALLDPVLASMYLNKEVHIEGTIRGIGFSSGSSNWVELDAGVPEGKYCVRCMVSPGLEFVTDDIIKMTGQVVKVSGICRGLKEGNIVIENTASNSLPMLSAIIDDT